MGELARANRVKLGKGKHSGVALTHVLTRKGDHRVIAGCRVTFRPKLNKVIVEGGTGGSKGTLELSFDKQGMVAEVFREVPEIHQGNGIGTDLLKGAEKVAKKIGCGLIYARTGNQRAKKSYRRAGWEEIDVPGMVNVFGKYL